MYAVMNHRNSVSTLLTASGKPEIPQVVKLWERLDKIPLGLILITDQVGLSFQQAYITYATCR